MGRVKKANEYLAGLVLLERNRTFEELIGEEKRIWIECIHLSTKVTEKTLENKLSELKEFIEDEASWKTISKSSTNVVKEFILNLNDNQGALNALAEELKTLRAHYKWMKLKDDLESIKGKLYLHLDNMSTIIESDHGEDVERVEYKFSVLSESMLTYDKAFFDWEGWINENDGHLDWEYVQEIYRPYFAEFYTTKIPLSLIQKDFEEGLQEGHWLEAHLLEEGEQSERLLDGELLYSASPIRRNGKQLVYDGVADKDELEKDIKIYAIDAKNIYKCKDKKSKKKLEGLLDTYLLKTSFFMVKIYNVGQGNCQFVETEHQKLFFDMGLTDRSSSGREAILVEKAMKEIRKEVADTIILSHWDMDHILGVTNMHDDNYNQVWIVPCINDIASIGVNARRLCKYIEKNPRAELIAISGDYNGSVIYQKNGFILGKGNGDHQKTGKSICGCEIKGQNSKNNFGLILHLEANKKEILLAGDVEYASMPSVFTMKMPTNMVVPHHGSKFLSFTYGINYVPGNAYISAGLNSHHCEDKATIPSGKSCKCHPHDCHLLYLYNSGYNVHKTQDTDVYGLYLG